MKNILKWIVRIALLLLLGLTLILGGFIIYDMQTGEQTADNTNATYTSSDGTELTGYLAVPDGTSGDGEFPAVLLIHEWWGLNHGMTVLADALADEGYVVFAPDVYRGRLAETVPSALWLRLFRSPDERVVQDVDGALTWLKNRDDVDGDRVASMGFCFGGGHSLQLGMRESENLALTILYYGAVVTDPDLLAPLTEGRGVLGVFGEDDQSIPTQDVLEFEAALNSLNIENEVTIYADANHGFLNEDNYDDIETPAGQAWQQTLEFLAENLGE